MPVYKMHKRGRSGRRVSVRAEHFEINIPAIIISILLAFAIWLYIVNFASESQLSSEPSPAPETTETALETGGGAFLSALGNADQGASV